MLPIWRFEASMQVRNALEKVYRHPEKLTKDVGGLAEPPSLPTPDRGDDKAKAAPAAVH